MNYEMSGKGAGREDHIATEQKDITVDVLRGAAIFTMAAASIAGEILVQPHRFLVRGYGSFAAPMFIFLSGMLVARTVLIRNHTFGHYLLRGILLIAVGALIDLAGGKWPFISFDVLYLIGAAAPLTFLFLRLPRGVRWILTAAVFAAGPILERAIGYSGPIAEVSLGVGIRSILSHPGLPVREFFIDGWFPLFPWLGFSFLGANLAELRWLDGETVSFGKPVIGFSGGSLAVAGVALFFLYPGPLFVRNGYSELFYPPSFGYLIAAAGIILLGFFIVDRRPSMRLFDPLRALGESSLFMYILHLSIVAYILIPHWRWIGFKRCVLIYAATASVLIAVGYGLRAVKKRWENRPYLARFLLGD